MKAHSFNSNDSISTIGILATLKNVCDVNNIHKGVVMLVLCYYVIKTLSCADQSHVCRGTSITICRIHGQQRGKVFRTATFLPEEGSLSVKEIRGWPGNLEKWRINSLLQRSTEIDHSMLGGCFNRQILQSCQRGRREHLQWLVYQACQNVYQAQITVPVHNKLKSDLDVAGGIIIVHMKKFGERFNKQQHWQQPGKAVCTSTIEHSQLAVKHKRRIGINSFPIGVTQCTTPLDDRNKRSWYSSIRRRLCTEFFIIDVVCYLVILRRVLHQFPFHIMFPL